MNASTIGAAEIRPYDLGAMAGRPPTRDAPLFGQRVAAFRKQAGLTQAKLAEQLGVSVALIAYYERNTPNPTVDVVQRLATFFGVPASHLLDIEPTKRPGKRGPVSEIEQRLAELQKLPRTKQRLLIRMLDAFIEENRAAE
jgi:transcriptional regulator with XRE-family HTH domain